MKAIHIDSYARTVTMVEYETTEDLQKLVGGYIETAANMPGGDVCFVDEKGGYKSHTSGFQLGEGEQRFVGNGVIVGRSLKTSNQDPVVTLEQLQSRMVWLSKEAPRPKAPASHPS